jgi:hypothetical protein
MRLHVVFDEEGQILGAALIDRSSPVRARPLADEQASHRSADVDVPAEYRHYDLAAVCQRLRVDSGGKFPNLKVKEEPSV